MLQKNKLDICKIMHYADISKKRYIMIKIFLAFSGKTFNFQYENSSILGQVKLAGKNQVIQTYLQIAKVNYWINYFDKVLSQ